MPIESTDWIAVQANGINLLGEIVGIAQNSIGTTRAFHYDPNTKLIKLLPGPISTSSSYFGPKINDLGVICTTDAGFGVAVYTPNGASYFREDLAVPANQVVINNSNGVIAGWYNSSSTHTAFRIVPNLGVYTSATISQFPGHRFIGISDAWICGDRDPSGNKKRGANRLPEYGFTSDVQFLQENGWAADVNVKPVGETGGGDVLISLTGVLYRNEVQLTISNLIDPVDKALWDANPNRVYRSISNRDSTTGFGLIGLSTQSPNQ